MSNVGHLKWVPMKKGFAAHYQLFSLWSWCYGKGSFETLTILIFPGNILHLPLGSIRASLAEQSLLASWSQEKEVRNHGVGILVMTISGCQNRFKIASTQRVVLQTCV